MKKPILQKRAVALRKEGLSYSEILKKVPVARSTLCIWLRSVNLSKRQKQKLTQRKLDAIIRGGIKVHQNRLNKCSRIREQALREAEKMMENPLWLAGIMLYWGEGTKEKENSHHGQRVAFNNSDPKMLKVYLKWLEEVLKISGKDIKKEIYIHETGNLEKALEFWSKELACEKTDFKVYFKKNKVKKVRYNNENYYGLVRITVRKSTNLNRRIAGWTEGICKYWGAE